MSVASIIDPTTGKIYDGLIGQGGGINLDKGQIITATTQNEVAFPTVPPANGSVLSYDATTDTGLRYIANNPTALALNYQQLFSATAGNNITPVPASAHDNYVLTSDTDPANPTGLVWKAVGGSGVIQTNAPLDDAEVANVSTISINYTAVKGEIPAGSGVAKVGVLVPAPAQDKYVLTSDINEASGLKWAPPTGAGGIIDATAPLVDDTGVGTNTISINFTAVKGEIPAGGGVAKTGVLVPAPAQDKWVLTSASAEASGLKWAPPTGGGGIIDATAPLVDDTGVGTNTISINYTAVKGELPAGNGTAKTGALVPAPPTNGYVLTAESSEATGLKWLPAGSGPAQTNFFRLTVPATPPFTTSGVEIELPAPNTIGTFTNNEQITIMNYEIPASSANTFSFPSLPFMGASYGATGTDANNQTCWFVEDYGGIGCFLLKAQLPLSANTNELVWGVFSNTPATSGNIGDPYVSGIVATTNYVYFYGYFDEFNTASGATPIAVLTNVGNIVRYEKATGIFSKVGTGGLVYSGNGGSGEICSVCVCPTDDKSLGNYLSNPKTLVLGGSFTQTLGGALACPYIAFYDEGTNTFSIVGDQAGDGITAPAPVAVSGIPTYYITSLVYNTNTNALLVSMNKVDYTWTIGGVPFVQYNGITSFGWKIAPVSTALSLGTAGQILNASNRGIGIGIVFSAVQGKYWLLIGYTDTAGTNCWWKLLDEPVGNAFLPPTSPTPPLQYRGASGTTCDIPQQLLYGRNSSTSENQSPVPFVNPPVDGSASRLIWIDDTANSTYVAFYNEGADTTSSIQQFISSATTAGSWTAIAKSQDQFAVNQSLLPSIVLLFGANSQGQSLVADTAFVGILYIPSGITYYSASGTGGVATATKVKFGSSYSSIQASVDTTANTYRLVNNYGNIQFS
jgi:hypothetical protein